MITDLGFDSRFTIDHSRLTTLKKLLSQLTNSICTSALCTALACCTILGCQPKADYTTVKEPLKNFKAELDDSIRGAKSIEDLSCYFYLALKGDISYEQLSKFIPDSNELVRMYTLTGSKLPTGQEIKIAADTIHFALHRSFIETKSRASIFHASWLESKYDNVMILEMEGQKLPSKKIIIVAQDDKQTLRASALCMQIDGRWFIGEDIRFGV